MNVDWTSSIIEESINLEQGKQVTVPEELGRILLDRYLKKGRRVLVRWIDAQHDPSMELRLARILSAKDE